MPICSSPALYINLFCIVLLIKLNSPLVTYGLNQKKFLFRMRFFVVIMISRGWIIFIKIPF